MTSRIGDTKRKFEPLGVFSSERKGWNVITKLQVQVINIQRELLDYQSAKIFKLQEELEALKK